MKIRLLMIMLVAALCAWPCSDAWPAAFKSQPSNQAHALLISAEPAADAALADLASIVSADYGVPRDQVAWLKGSDVTSIRIEEAVMARMRALKANDQLFVVLALRIHAKGDDRILVTSDFDAARPWTGFPLSALRKLTTTQNGATVLVIHPECQSQTESPSANAGVDAPALYNQNAQARQTRTMIGYCAPSSDGTVQFLQRLNSTLADLAKNPGTRAPWQSADDRGLVSVAELVGRLNRDGGGRELAIEAGSGWLRVTGTRRGGDTARALADLDGATTSADVTTALAAVMASEPDDTSPELNRIAAALSGYVLDESKQEAWRTLTVQALGDLPAPVAQPVLEDLYARARSGAIRRTVLGEWMDLNDERAPVLLRSALGDTDPQVRIAAIQMLGMLNDTASRAAIERQLNESQDPQERAAAVRVLSSGSSPQDDTAPVLRGLQDPDASVRVEAASAVARLPATASVVPALLQALGDGDARVRESAAYALGRHWSAMDAATASRVSHALLQHIDETAGAAERVAVLWALARGKRVETTPHVAATLRTPAPLDVRLAAVDALEAFADPRGVAALVQVTAESPVEPRLQLAAIRALGVHDRRESVDALFALAASPNASVSEAAMTALAHLRAPTPVAIALASKDTTPAPLRLVAIDHLGRSGDRDSLRVLLGLLGSGDTVLSARAARALSMNDSASLTGKLAALLTPGDNPDSIRIAAATALVGIDSDAARTQLATYRNDANEGVRLKVVESIDAKSVTPRGKDTLLAMARDPSPAVRREVAATLGQINDAASLDALREMSRDTDASVRAVAIDGVRAVDPQIRAPAATDTGDASVVVYTRNGGTDRALRVDVFWCRGPDDASRKAQARAKADELAALARSGKLAPAVIASVRLRPLSEEINKDRGYRVGNNQIRFEPGDASERAWVDRFLSMWGREFVAYPVTNRTPDYISFFYCAGN